MGVMSTKKHKLSAQRATETWQKFTQPLIRLLPSRLQKVADRFARFALVGALATLLNYAVFYVLYTWAYVHYNVASASGYIAGVFLGFTLNRSFTFEYRRRGISVLLSYVAVYAASLILSLLFLSLLVEAIGMDPRIGNVLAICLSTLTNFIGCHYFVFDDDARKRVASWVER